MLALSRGGVKAVIDESEDYVYGAAFLWADDRGEFDSEQAGRFAHVVAMAAREFCRVEFGSESIPALSGV